MVKVHLELHWNLTYGLFFNSYLTQVFLELILLCWPVKGQNNVCPSDANLAPCTCHGSGEGQGVLRCFRGSLNDDLASQILDQFTTPELRSFLKEVNMQSNQLTRVPIQIPLFPQVNYVDLQSNQITTIQSGAFNFAVTLFTVNVHNNLITSIEAGAFQGISNLDSFSRVFWKI